ncbi:type I-A CRISPR-associated protein Cas4/Csa1 [Ignicoccus islandicus]|nr:type I-A CRISPR-associated protein Cas4/Csa1 [Ignicoccus islandicus]
MVTVRGWDWSLLQNRAPVKPTVSEVTSPCPTKRDSYLRRVLGARPSSPLLEKGKMVHEAFMSPFRGEEREFKEELLKKVHEEAKLRKAIADEEGIPYKVESKLPGSVIGLSTIVKPDFLVGFMPVELVYGWNGNVERKKLALAAYALVIEAWTGLPIDAGVVINVNDQGIKYVLVRIGDYYRRKFLEERDYLASILSRKEDPGRAESCPNYCPFAEVCKQ